MDNERSRGGKETPRTYSISFPKSSLIMLLAICITANAAYPGSAIWLMLKISASRAWSRSLSLKGSGFLRNGGNGLELVTDAERRARREVISWEVTFVKWIRRLMSLNHDVWPGSLVWVLAVKSLEAYEISAM